jgi:Xaa-Pro aminopeptidase
MDASVYAKRRETLAAGMQRGIAVVPTAPERTRNRDAHYPYRFDSYFYYLSGFTEPEAVLVVVAGGGKRGAARSILFCRDKDPEREVWDGFRYGPEGARAAFGFDEAYSIGRIDEVMPDLLGDQPALFTHLGADDAWDSQVMRWINDVRARSRSGVTAPQQIVDPHALLDEMRVIKDAQEIAVMRRAAEISTAAHRRAMRASKPGIGEFAVEAELMHEFRRHGAQAPAYTPIVASGAHACVLHYVDNANVLRDGDLLLIDAGCELDGYASDITRTFPVNGRFSAAQREVYELVLAAQEAAIAQVKPGSAWNAAHDAAVEVLAQGFIDLGLIEGSLEQALESESYKRFYMHRTGHWLGLDVHDAGDYKRDGEWRGLVPGMVLTVEPGCYIRPGPGVPEAYAGIGVRIEDDALVTADGCEIITHAAPKTVSDIEALMRG